MVRCLNGPMQGQTYQVGSQGLQFGRDNACAVRFPDGTPGVSRRHCRLYWSQGGPALVDLGSSYGTFLTHGKQLPPNCPDRWQPGPGLLRQHRQSVSNHHVLTRGGRDIMAEIRQKIISCSQGHYYDANRYDQCPYCSAGGFSPTIDPFAAGESKPGSTVGPLTPGDVPHHAGDVQVGSFTPTIDPNQPGGLSERMGKTQYVDASTLPVLLRR